MNATNIHVGATVTIPGKAAHEAVVVAVGGCDWARCQHGADCVTVRREGKTLTENFSAAELVVTG
jgi:hypothetical protein